MRLPTILCSVCFLSALGTAVSSGQHQHPGPNRAAHEVMGFDQHRTTHHFFLFADGGAIDVTVKDSADAKNRDAIRAHLPHIATLFGTGDFEAPMLVHRTTNVPGTSVMAAKNASIRYRYVETANGGRVEIQTTDPEALAAVHAFLKFQITDHKTGDPLTVRPR
jgi:hypothetical protein